jgi:hypothetical protein
LLPGAYALITRSATTPRIGAAFKKPIPWHGWFSATASTIEDDSENNVSYKDGDKEHFTKENLQELLEAYGK